MSNLRQQLRGTLTALVTPMNSDGSIDYGALDALVDNQLASGVNGLVPCGTTGEAVTLTANERQTIISRVVDKSAGRCVVVGGAGGNDTKVAIEHQKRAKDAGAHCSLIATPYYNKPTGAGLIAHYTRIVETVDMPVLLYNVPGRTACDMKPDVVAELANLGNIIGIKEATADLGRVTTLRESCGSDFVLLSGDDGTSCAFCLMGGDGVISVASNVVPKQMSDMIAAALRADVAAARSQHASLHKLFTALFLESNPIPVKAAMASQGAIQENYRLPLCPMSPAPRERLLNELRAVIG